MNKVVSSVVVLMVTFISASVAIMFVFGRTGMITGYSADVQNSSVCEGLATRADESGTEAAQEYEDQGCDEIYGDLEYRNQVEENTELMDGLTLNGWEQYAHYDTRHEYDFTVDFEELDGQEYIEDYDNGASFGGSDTFVYNEDYNYKVDLYIDHPYEDPEGGETYNWYDKTSWLWDIDGDCEGAECDYEANFTYSEHEGNLSDTFLPCQDTSGSNHNLVQKMSIRAEDSNGDRVAWVQVQNHNMTMVDWSGTECWQEDSLPSFEDGKIVVRSMNFTYPMNIHDDYTFKLDVNYDNESLDHDKLSITAGIPNGQVPVDDSEYGETRYEFNLDETSGCSPNCDLQFNVSLQNLDVPSCTSPVRDPGDISRDTVQFWLREKPDSDYHTLYNELVVGDNIASFSPYCWQGYGSTGIGGIGGL